MKNQKIRRKLNACAPKQDLYQAVTDKIIAALEKGTPPWKKPWRSLNKTVSGSLPCNALTGRRYNGVNVLLLWMAAEEKGYSANRWLTYRQAGESGGHVKTGECASLAILFKPFQVQAEDKDGNPLRDSHGDTLMVERAILKSMPLFNVDQCEGLPEQVSGIASTPLTTEEVEGVDAETSNRVLSILNATGVNICYRSQNQAFYQPVADSITLPLARQFFTKADFWSTLLHELVHSTGHQKRLAREGIIRNFGRFGDETYAFEELIAEVGSAFLCAELGIFGEVQHESYVASWLKVLKEDKRAIFRASRQAREACEFLLNQQGRGCSAV